MAVDEPAVQIRGLTKHYGRQVAVERLDFDLPRGVVAGLIGPNGAGKTTTLAMLLGLVRPTAGEGIVLGHSIADPAAYLGRVGALIEAPAFYRPLSGRQNLDFLATIANRDGGSVESLLDLVGLGARAGDRFRTYSTGMKQRLGIAAALLGDPELLLLDEPTSGLDPVGIAEMRSLLARLGHADRTILVSSHVLSELEQICDWLVIIDQGNCLYQGPTSQLLTGAGARLRVAPEHQRDLARLGELLAGRGWRAEPSDHHLIIAADGRDPREVAAKINRAAMEEGIVLVGLSELGTRLEDRYLAMVSGGEE